MKTTITILLGILCFFIATFLAIESVQAVNNANHLYTDITSAVVYDFKLTFLFTAFVLALLSIVFIGHAVWFFKLFYNNYCNIMNKKRDNDIKAQLINNKYEKLYHDLNSTNIYEEKQKIINKFFHPTTTDEFKEKLGRWIDKMRAEPMTPRETFTSEQVIDLRKNKKQDKIVPERDTFHAEGSK